VTESTQIPTEDAVQITRVCGQTVECQTALAGKKLLLDIVDANPELSVEARMRLICCSRLSCPVGLPNQQIIIVELVLRGMVMNANQIAAVVAEHFNGCPNWTRSLRIRSDREWLRLTTLAALNVSQRHIHHNRCHRSTSSTYQQVIGLRDPHSDRLSYELSGFSNQIADVEPSELSAAYSVNTFTKIAALSVTEHFVIWKLLNW
jgi:hypothetical protein